MTDDERRRWKERYQDYRIERLEEMLTQSSAASPEVQKEHKKLMREVIGEKRSAADAPERARFEKDHEQRERHHRDIKWAARIAAGISIIGALASWAGVWFQTHHSQSAATAANSTPSIESPSPTPTSSD